MRWVLHFVISPRKERWLRVVTGLGFCIWRSHTGAGVRFVTGIVFCILCYHTRKQGVRLVTGILFCILRYHTRDRRYDLLRPLDPASCDITHETGVTICYGHWVLHRVISHTRQGARFVTDTRDTEYDLLRALGSASCDITDETGGTICYAHWGLHLVISHTRQRV